jgi:hypothetical protein
MLLYIIPLISQGNDPNGIRTRVTAVKGRCPGPLDDRVIQQLSDGQYQDCAHARKQIGGRISSYLD